MKREVLGFLLCRYMRLFPGVLFFASLAQAGPPASHSSTAQESVASSSLGRCVGDPDFRAEDDLNGDGCVNVLDIARLQGLRPTVQRRAAAGSTESIEVEPLSTAMVSGGTAEVLFLIQNNTTALLGYSLDVEIEPIAGAMGTVTVDVSATNFFEVQNLITAGGAELHPDFSVIIDPGDGGVFVNAITSDNSTVLAADGINDVLAQVFFDASADACGDFVIQLGPASALADGDAFPVPFGFTPGMISVRAPPCPADLTSDGIVNAGDLALLLGAWGPNPGHPADFNADGTINAADLAFLLGAWGKCP